MPIGVSDGLVEPFACLCEILVCLASEVFIGPHRVDVGNAFAGEVFDGEFPGIGAKLCGENGEYHGEAQPTARRSSPSPSAARIAVRVSSSIPLRSENRRGSRRTRRFLRASSIPDASRTSCNEPRVALGSGIDWDDDIERSGLREIPRHVSELLVAFLVANGVPLGPDEAYCCVWRVDRNNLSGCPPRPGIS